MSDERSAVRSSGRPAKSGRRMEQKTAPPVGTFPRHSSPVNRHALIRLAGYLIPLWPKLTAGVVCLVVVSLLSLYYGKLAELLVDAIKKSNHDLLNHYALLAVAVFL